MVKMETLDKGLTLVERYDGYYAHINIPMYPPDLVFLWTRDYKIARRKAYELYNAMLKYK